MWPWLIVVESTLCGVAVVLVMVVVMVEASGSCRGQPPRGPVACGLSLVVYMKVHTGFIVFVAVYNLLPHPPVVLWPVVCTLWFP